MTTTAATQEEWFRNHVSATMSILGVHEPDADGDFPVRGTTSPGWVRIEAVEPWGVRVFAVAATGVPAKLAVYKEINEAHLADRAMRARLLPDGAVYVDYYLFADAVTTDNLRSVIGRVLELADELGPMLAAVHGGSTPLAPQSSPSER